MIKAYCDSSFDEKRGIAGIGIVIENGSKRRIVSNWVKVKSNNEAELAAIHIASILTEGKGVIYTDSQTAIAYVEGNIKDKPRTKEQYVRHKHCEYYAYQIRKRGIKIEKIKAHQSNFQTHSLGNRLADLLANEGRAKYYERNKILDIKNRSR